MGAWVQGEADVLRVTRTMVFAQGVARIDGKPVLRVSGTFKIGQLFDRPVEGAGDSACCREGGAFSAKVVNAGVGSAMPAWRHINHARCARCLSACARSRWCSAALVSPSWWWAIASQ